MSLTEAQKRAKKKYAEKNKDKVRVADYKRTARMYIKNHATSDDLNEFRLLIDERKKNI